MKILVTAGNTMAMIDKVRGISNIFKGRTGFMIAQSLYNSGHDVTLLTSNPEIVDAWKDQTGRHYPISEMFHTVKYRTYDELYTSMKSLITTKGFDVVIHSAAVSDYAVEGTYVQAADKLRKIDSSSKIGSEYKELYLRLVPTEKIVDRIREWGFGGVLVKFKLQVGMSDEELIEIAEKSRQHSDANLIVANTLEGSSYYAYIIGIGADPMRVSRGSLPMALENSINDIIANKVREAKKVRESK